jgi:hypothetical protein
MMNNSDSRLMKHVHAHEAVITNEDWYGDGPPFLKAQFSAEQTAERQAEIVDLLEKGATKSKAAGDRQQFRPLKRLANKLDRCRPHHRCGSLACPQCARAFQRAKADAQKQVLTGLGKKSPAKANTLKQSADGDSAPTNPILVMATVIPLQLKYSPDNIIQLDVAKRNRWLKDMLAKAGVTEIMVGSADISWEQRRNEYYYQLHWHLAMWATAPEELRKQLLRVFPPKNKYDRPVTVTKLVNLEFLPYINKAIKLPDLLRRNRQHLPQLLLALDSTAPLDLMVITGLRLSVQSSRLALRPFGQGVP